MMICPNCLLLVRTPDHSGTRCDWLAQQMRRDTQAVLALPPHKRTLMAEDAANHQTG